MPVLIFSVLAVAMVSLLVGAAPLSIADVWSGLRDGDGVTGLIVREIRMPRMLLSVTIGAFLGLSGAALQGLLQNPLAEAAIFGAPQAAALGAVLVLYLGFSDALSFWLPLASICGAGLSGALLYLLVGRQGSIIGFILAGLALGSFTGAAISLVINLSANPFAITEIVFWLMGSFEDRSVKHVFLSLPFLIVASVLIFLNGRGYRALTLGADTASSLGINVAVVQWTTVTAIAIGTGAGVAVSGAIGFVGLIAPHLARSLAGADPQRILAPSAFLGSILLTCADIAVRLIPSTSEIKIGAVTSLLGAPLFLYLVIARRYSSAGTLE